MSSADGTTKVIVLAFFANLGIAIAKFTGAFISHSASLLAEAVHSLVDCANQLLLLLGGKLSQKSPTERHPLGYGREAFFWSFIVAVMLFSLGGMFAIYEGIHKFHEPAVVSGAPILGLSILVFSLILETYSFVSCLKEVHAQNRFGSLWQWFRRTTSSELLVIFTEDAAALAGLVLATLCLLASWLTGDARWDATGSVLVGALLIIVAVLLAIEVKSLIIGEAAGADYAIPLEKHFANLLPGAKVLHVIALQTGAHETMLACKFHPGSVSEVQLLVDAMNEIERRMKADHPELRWQFLEPDTLA